MTANGWFQIALYLLVIFLVTKPLGVFMTRVFSREKTFLDPLLRPIEKLVYKLVSTRSARCVGPNTRSQCCCSAACP